MASASNLSKLDEAAGTADGISPAPPIGEGRAAFALFWKRRSRNTQAALLITVSMAISSGVSAMARYYGGQFGPFQQSLMVSLVSLLVLIPALIWRPATRQVKAGWGLHILRGTLGFIAFCTMLVALVMLPFIDAIGLSFTTSLFTTIFAVIFLREKVRWRRWTATLVGFGGIVLMIVPGHESFEEPAWAYGIALVAAAFAALTVIVLKRLTRQDLPTTMAATSAIVTGAWGLAAVLAAPLLADLVVLPGGRPLVWVWPSVEGWIALVLLGALSIASQMLAIEAYTLGEASVIAPFDYTRMVFAGAIGVAVFDEVPTMWTLVGACIVVAAALYTTRREAVVAPLPPGQLPARVLAARAPAP